VPSKEKSPQAFIECTPIRLEEMIAALREVGKNRLVDVLYTHRSVVEQTGELKLPNNLLNQIDDALETWEAMQDADLDPFDKIVPFTPKEIASAEIDEYPENPDGMSDDEIVNLDKKMDLLLDPRTEIRGNTAFVPQEVLDEIEAADRELDSDLLPQCRCGCGGRTRGGFYLPGHDAKHKGILMRKVYHGNAEVTEAAMLELEIRGWAKFYPAFARNEAKRIRRSKTAKCRICGRPLTDEESVENQIGPICQGRHGK
jgi:hypothetical protein